MSEPFKSLEEIINEANSFSRSTVSEDIHDFLARLSATLQTHELREKAKLAKVKKMLEELKPLTTNEEGYVSELHIETILKEL